MTLEKVLTQMDQISKEQKLEKHIIFGDIQVRVLNNRAQPKLSTKRSFNYRISRFIEFLGVMNYDLIHWLLKIMILILSMMITAVDLGRRIALFAIGDNKT